MRRLLTALFLVSLVSCTSLKRCGYEGFRRDSWQEPERVVEALGLSPGDRVGDVGAGGGYFSFRLADAVGPSGTLYAVDVDRGMIDYIESAAAKRGYENVAVILAEFDDPLLPDGTIDLIFTCNTYHHLENRVDYFERVRADLAPGGRVAIVDFDAPGWLRRHYTEKEAALDEMREAGYRLVADHDFLERQIFLIFAPAGS